MPDSLQLLTFTAGLTNPDDNLESPWRTMALPLNLIQVPLGLTLLPVVDSAFLLVVRKLLKLFGPGHSLQTGHPIGSGFRYGVMLKCVDEDPERMICCPEPNNILFTDIYLIWVGVQQKEKSTGFA